VRIADDTNRVVIRTTDAILVSLWKDIESRLLTEQEAVCLVAQTSDFRNWRALGVSMSRRFIPENGAFIGTIVPANSTPSAPDLILRFRIDRVDYRVFHGRFFQEDVGEDVLRLRRDLLIAKQTPELMKADVIEGVRNMTDVKAWLESDKCRGIRLDEDQEGATYYSVDLFRRCDGQDRAESLAGFAVDKRSGDIRGPQGITFTAQRLANAAVRLGTVAVAKSAAENRLNNICSRAGR
jgi:hypothetical protein